MAPIDIGANGDLTVEVVEYDDTIIYRAGDKKVPKQTCYFKVSRAVLIKHSTTFEHMLAGPWKESRQDAIKLEERVKRMDVILHILHESNPVLTMNGKEMWYLVEGLDYYRLDIELFEVFFATWYNGLANHLQNAQELVFLTWPFDSAKPFASLTKILAYDSIGHI